jgi:hypothetical protein
LVVGLIFPSHDLIPSEFLIPVALGRETMAGGRSKIYINGQRRHRQGPTGGYEALKVLEKDLGS